MCERRIKQTCSPCPALVSKLIALKPDIFYRKPSIKLVPRQPPRHSLFSHIPHLRPPLPLSPTQLFCQDPVSQMH